MFGRLQLYIFIGILVFGALSAGYYSWRKGIEREALLEYNQAQLEQNIKDQQALKEKLENITHKQKEIEQANSADKKIFNDKIGNISNDLNSAETVATDKPSSQILKDTVKKLQKVTK